MPTNCNLLIIGAGPTGLATALFLANRGHRPRSVEKARAIASFSKAFGVNVRSLKLLEPTGVTQRFVENGRKMASLRLHHGGTHLATLRFAGVDAQYPFMCVQSQAESERILEAALAARGIPVERGVEAIGIRIEAGRAIVDLAGAGGTETVIARHVLGADGAGSLVRKALGFRFDGAAYDAPWRLWDLDLEIPLDPDDGHIFLLPRGGMFVVRQRDSIWRVLGSGPHLFDALPAGTVQGKVHWQSEFQVSDRVAGRFSKGPVHLAGDAAHIHAGIGARGMNLGIEDAFVFAELFHKTELHRYDAVRRPIVQKVVRQITRMMSIPRAETAPGQLVRKYPGVVRLAVPLLRSRIQPWILGLDHDLIT